MNKDPTIEWDAEASRKEAEAEAAGLLESRPRWRRDYENAMRRAGISPTQQPVVISLTDDDNPVVDGYHASLDGPAVRGARITGARFTNHRGPSGFVVRDVMLLTDGAPEVVDAIDAVINGVPLILRWNGMQPKVQWTAHVLTADEAAAIQNWKG